MTETNRIEFKLELTKDLGLVEQLGSGVPRILEDYGKECFKFSDNFLRMIFPKNIKSDEKGESETSSISGLVEGLVDSQQKIVRLIVENPKISKKKMAISIGISTTSIDKNIVALKDKNIIKRVGSDSGGHWKIIDNK